MCDLWQMPFTWSVDHIVTRLFLYFLAAQQFNIKLIIDREEEAASRWLSIFVTATVYVPRPLLLAIDGIPIIQKKIGMSSFLKSQFYLLLDPQIHFCCVSYRDPSRSFAHLRRTTSSGRVRHSLAGNFFQPHTYSPSHLLNWGRWLGNSVCKY